jgi:dipeptidyl aminopeptidase/acylaminoacyl peptidase
LRSADEEEYSVPFVVLVAIALVATNSGRVAWADTSLPERPQAVDESGALSAQALTPGMGQQTPAASAQTATSGVKVEENVLCGTVNGTEPHMDIRACGQRERVAPRGDSNSRQWMDRDFDKSTMRGMGQFLARHGFVAFAVDYRLFHGKDNLWPARLDDVQRAARWVRANASKYAVSPEKMGAFGHSAGGHLAALLGKEDTRDNSDAALAKYSSRVQAVVDVSGPTDFTKDHDAESIAFLTGFLGVDYAKHPEVWQDRRRRLCFG